MAVQQAIVIGLGQFGMALSRALTHQGVEVVAVDRKASSVQLASEFCAEALAMDAMSEEDLASLHPADRDLCVCAIGDESREASIVVTALFRQLGARRIVSRATDALHERILHLVGAHEVVTPERSYGDRLAVRLAQRSVIDIQPLGAGINLTEIAAPASLLGRPLSALRLPQRFRLTVVAVRRMQAGQPVVLPATAELELQPGDVVVVVGPPGAAEEMAKGV